VIGYIIDFACNIDLNASAAHSVTPHRSSSPHDLPPWPTFRRAPGIKGAAANVDSAGAVFGGGFAHAVDAPPAAGV